MKKENCPHLKPEMAKARVNDVTIIVTWCPKCGDEIGRRIAMYEEAQTA